MKINKLFSYSSMGGIISLSFFILLSILLTSIWYYKNNVSNIIYMIFMIFTILLLIFIIGNTDSIKL